MIYVEMFRKHSYGMLLTNLSLEDREKRERISTRWPKFKWKEVHKNGRQATKISLESLGTHLQEEQQTMKSMKTKMVKPWKPKWHKISESQKLSNLALLMKMEKNMVVTKEMNQSMNREKEIQGQVTTKRWSKSSMKTLSSTNPKREGKDLLLQRKER